MTAFSHCFPTNAKSKRSARPEFAESSCRRTGFAQHRQMIVAIAQGVISGNSQPFLPSSTTSPQNFVVTIGSFHACASSCVRPKPSENVGKINMSAFSIESSRLFVGNRANPTHLWIVAQIRRDRDLYWPHKREFYRFSAQQSYRIQQRSNSLPQINLP